MKHLQIITTTDNADVARRIAKQLVGKKLAACVQISGPIDSFYCWQGKVESSREWRCSIKTVASIYPKVEAAIQNLHNYDVPQIIALEIVAGNLEYLNWIEENIQP